MSRVEPVKRAMKGRDVAPLTDAVFVEKVICFFFRAITTEIASIRGISRIAFHMELFFALSIGNTFNPRDENTYELEAILCAIILDREDLGAVRLMKDAKKINPGGLNGSAMWTKRALH